MVGVCGGKRKDGRSLWWEEEDGLSWWGRKLFVRLGLGG